MSILKAFAMALAAPSLIFAQQAAGQTAQEGESEVTPSPERAFPSGMDAARDGNFTLGQLTVPDIEVFWKEWEQPTPPRLTTTSQSERNTPVFAVLMFSNCTPDSAGNCNLSASVEISGPDGSPYEDKPVEMPDYTGKAVANRLRLMPGAVGFHVEDGQPLGTYTLSARLTDNVSGKTLVTSVPVEIREETVSESGEEDG